jgi:hypothetical protein
VPESFVPFDPSESRTPPTSGPQLKVMPKAEAKADFSPLEAPPKLTVHDTHGASSGGPQVTLQREGDRVTAIRIECQCGQVIELTCSY